VSREYEIIEVRHDPTIIRMWELKATLTSEERSSIARSLFLLPQARQTSSLYLLVCIKQSVVVLSKTGIFRTICRFPYTFSPKCSAMNSRGQFLVFDEYGHDMCRLSIGSVIGSSIFKDPVVIPSEVTSILACTIDDQDRIYLLYNTNMIGRIDFSSNVMIPISQNLQQDDINWNSGSLLYMAPSTLYVFGANMILQYHLDNPGHVCRFEIPWRMTSIAFESDQPQFQLREALYLDPDSPLAKWPPGVPQIIYAYACPSPSFIASNHGRLHLQRLVL